MKAIVSLFYLALIVVVCSCKSVPPAQTTLLPGLTYYEGSEKLSDKLVFLFCNDSDKASRHNDDTCASIFTFGLSDKKLSKLTDCPNGWLARPGDDLLCVNYKLVGSGQYATNMFIISVMTHQERFLNLEAVPKSIALMGDRAFFELEGSGIGSTAGYFYHTTNGVKFETKIDCYDFSKDQMSTVSLPGASLWEFDEYKNMHLATGQTNIIHFQYNTHGKRVTTGRDYPKGIYSLDTHTGDIHLVSDESIDRDDEMYFMTAFNAKRILFIGDNGPIAGHELISTEEADPDPKTYAAQHKNINVLHSFPQYPSLIHEINYTLHGISPDKHYVLVRKSETDKKSTTGETASYYLVDVVTGNTRVLLKDETGTVGKGAIQSSLFWVAKRNE